MKSRITSGILRSTALFSGAEMLSLACGVIRTKVIALIAGAAGVGLLGILMSACDMAGAVVTSGLRTGGVRTIASETVEQRPEVIGLIRRIALWLGLGLGAATFILSPALSYISFAVTSRWAWFAAVALAVVFNSFTASEGAVMQGTGRMKPLAAASAEGAVLSLLLSCCAIYFIRDEAGIVAIVIIYSAITALTYVFNGRSSSVYPAKSLSMKEVFREGRALMRVSGALMLAGVAALAAGYAVISIIGFTSGVVDSGLYQAGYLIMVRYFGIIFTSMAVEYYPRLSRRSVGPWRAAVMMRHECMTFLPLVTAGGIVLALIATPLVKLLYDESFVSVVPMILLAVPSLVARVVAWNMAFVILAQGSARLYLVTECLGAVMMVICVAGGYTLLGLAGAGLGITVEYLFYAAMEAIVLQRKFGISAGRRVWLTATVCFVASAVMAFVGLCFYLLQVCG